jgi:fibronectin type 3 domain-containing protein
VKSFSLTPILPDGWGGSVNPASLSLLPGAAGSAVLTATSLAGAVAGDYTVAAMATATGVSSGSATATYTVLPDIVPPTAPTNLMAKPGRAQVGLFWLASTDNATVAGYQIWRNGALLKTIATTSYTDKAVVSGTSYTYYVKAVDGGGNLSGASNQASATPTRTGVKK